MSASDTEDEDFKRAIALSLASSKDSKIETSTDDAPATAPFSMVGLNRKAMEEERLARRGIKREASISPPPSRKAPKLEQNTVSLPSGARLTSFSSIVNQQQTMRKSGIANAANDRLKRSASPARVKQEPVDEDEARVSTTKPRNSSLQYPTGIVKKTWAFGFDRKADDIKLEEVLEPSTLRTAVLSSFQWDIDWVFSKLKVPPNGGTTRCIFVMEAKEAKLRQEMQEQTQHQRAFLRLCLPRMEGQVNCMHSKLMLLFHPDKLRIAIPTANLLPLDWGETGHMENNVFMIDLPRLPNGEKAHLQTMPAFAQDLQNFLRAQDLPPDVLTGILNFDYTATAPLAFIHTIGGITRGADAARTCLPGLSRAVRALTQSTTLTLQLDFAASSIGSLNDAFLTTLYNAARGIDLLALPPPPTAAQTKAAASSPNPTSTSSPQNIRDQYRVYFPTAPTVTASLAGAAGSICLSRKWFEGAAFPRSAFRDYKSTRRGLLSHNKILYARGRDHKGGDVAWAYVGSANLSESAWGRMVYDRKDKAWRVNGRNWECGVLMGVGREALKGAEREGEAGWGVGRSLGAAEAVCKEEVETEDEDDEVDGAGAKMAAKGASEGVEKPVVSMRVFDELVPPPFELPGEAYAGREPWYFMD